MSLASCSFPALGTTATLLVTEPRGLACARAALTTELIAVDETCSRFRPDSELVWLNRCAGRWTPVSRRLFEAIEVALRAAAATRGLVDPTIGRALRLSGYDRSFELVRRGGRTRRVRVAPGPDWRAIELDPAACRVRLPAGTELDLGATAKALAADRGAAAAAGAARCGVLVSLGGDVAVAGDPPSGGWPVGLADDHATPLEDTGPVVAVVDGGLATSSTRVRRWRAGSAELHHIVDPRTGSPAAETWRTATVAAATCVDANAASTAAIVLGASAPSWLEEHRLPALLVDATGRATAVAGWPEEAA